MDITIKVIPHTEQRYETTGDWVVDPQGNVTIYVSSVENWKSEYLVALHELVEVALCIDRGISQETVDEFDMSHPELEDPGIDQRAPYHKEHMVSVEIEKRLAQELGVNWEEHCLLLESLYRPPRATH